MHSCILCQTLSLTQGISSSQDSLVLFPLLSILFKKDLLIEQAMYNLYNQIEIKGLYFFCTRYDQKEKRMKYVILKPGETIEQVNFLWLRFTKSMAKMITWPWFMAIKTSEWEESIKWKNVSSESWFSFSQYGS